LGHVISAEGVSTNPEKIVEIQSWPTPEHLKHLRSFLGLAGYYRKFVRNFGVICKLMTKLLKKNTMFISTSLHQQAFSALKYALVEAPVLALPDFTKQFQVETDASDVGVGLVLMQQGHPMAFISKALGPRTKGLSTYEKEYLAILIDVDQWRSYLQPAEFLILTDRRSMSFLAEKRLHTCRRFFQS
jgi:hypothetical protein